MISCAYLSTPSILTLCIIAVELALMKLHRLSLLAALTLCTVSQTQALANPSLKPLFEDRFRTAYAPGRCADNILRLLVAARAAKIPLEHSRVLFIENLGGSLFGYLNVELARDEADPRERQWSYHVVLEHGGMIFDFDYTNQPRVDTIATYFERMFLDEDPKPLNGFYVGRKWKLKEYGIQIHPALNYLKVKEEYQKLPELKPVRFSEYLGVQVE